MHSALLIMLWIIGTVNFRPTIAFNLLQAIVGHRCPPAIHMSTHHYSNSKSSASKSTSKGLSKDLGDVRINKCLSDLSRRAADTAIAEGRVTVNGVQAIAGQKVHTGDIVRLDGKIQRWESTAKAKMKSPSLTMDDQDFIYLKYNKPVGVTCTNEQSDKSNIISKGRFDLLPQRVFTVGRLDKDSCGLILLTSDGRVNNALLHKSNKQEKVRQMNVDFAIGYNLCILS
jgi:23S rRNA-/tRNA-specific pseudouridylate synthase